MDEIKLLSTESRLLRRIVYSVCLATLVAVPVFEAFRGLDVTDMGFVLTNQRFVFTHPASVSYWFHLWLTNVVGGVVDLLFGRFGVLPHKLAAAVIFWAMAASVFVLYRRSGQRMLVLIGVTVSMAFNFTQKINIVHYNNLSALLFVLGAALLCEGSLSRQSWLFGLSGLVFALNAFARIPNLAGIGLIFVPAILDLFIPDPAHKLKVSAMNYMAFLLGVAAAAAVALAALSLLGHLPYYVQALRDLGNSNSIDAGSYGVKRVILRPIRDTLFSLGYGAPFAIALALVSAAVSLWKSRFVMAAGGVAVAVVAYLCIGLPLIRAQLPRATAGLCYWAALAILFDRRASREIKLSAVIAACLALALNLGSDTGIAVSMYVYPAMFPALLYAARSASGILASRIASGYRPMRSLAAVVAALFLGVSIFNIRYGVYRDVQTIHRTVRDPQLAHIFTSDARAQALEAVLPVIRSYVRPGGELLAYDSLCLIHFATSTLPYLNNPWPAQYKPSYLDEALRSKEKHGPLPVVVLARSNPRGSAWPSGTRPPANMEPVHAFLARNAYHLAWESPAFQIYTP